MEANKKMLINNIFKVLIKSLLIMFGVWGLILTFSSSGFMGNSKSLLYFTIQSNITIMLVTIIFLIADIVKMCGGKYFINQFWLVLKFIFTVAITVTMLVFFIILAPTMKVNYLLSMNNFSVHFLVPLFALIDFFCFDFNILIKKATPLYGTIMPLYYLFFALICSFCGVDFNGSKVPYYFLDYTKFGWFSFKNGMGVVYWIIILIIAIIGLSYLIAFAIRLIQKKKVKHS